MDTNFDRREKAVGSFLIIIAITVLITLLIIGRGKDWFETYATYYTIFNDSYNLKEGSPVKMNTEIGKVKAIAPFEDKVKVELTVKQDYAHRIKTDSIAVVQTTAIVYGTDFVSIRQGTTDAEPLAEGGMIGSTEKQSITELLNEYGAEFGVQEAARKINAIIQNAFDIVKRLKDPKGPLFTTLDNAYSTTFHVEGITRDLQAGRGTVGKLLKSPDLLDKIQAELDRVDVILENLGEASKRTPRTMDQVQESLDRVKRVLDEVIKSVSSISIVLKEVEEGSGEIPQLTQSAKRGVQEMRDTLENADKILQSLQNNFLIRPNLPPEPKGEATEAGLR